MSWPGIQIGLTTLALLVSLASPVRAEKTNSASSELSFQPTRTDGGAILGAPFLLPAELAPLPQPAATTFPRSISTDAKTPNAPTQPIDDNTATRSEDVALNLHRLWQIAAANHPELRHARGTFDEMRTEKRHEVLTQIRRGYFAYLGLVQEAQALEAASRGMEERFRENRLLLEGASATSTARLLLSLEALREEVKVQRRKNQADLQATWGRLAVAVGVPDLPWPTNIVDRQYGLPNWTLEEIEQRIRKNCGAARAEMEAHAIRRSTARTRSEVLLPVSSPGQATSRVSTPDTVSLEVPLSFWDRKQPRIRETETVHAHALATIRIEELKSLGAAREVWARYRVARHNLKRLNEQTLPRLRTRVDLVKQACESREGAVSFTDLCLAERDLFRAEIERSRTRCSLWHAIADLQGLMQISIDENPPVAKK